LPSYAAIDSSSPVYIADITSAESTVHFFAQPAPGSFFASPLVGSDAAVYGLLCADTVPSGAALSDSECELVTRCAAALAAECESVHGAMHAREAAHAIQALLRSAAAKTLQPYLRRFALRAAHLATLAAAHAINRHCRGLTGRAAAYRQRHPRCEPVGKRAAAAHRLQCAVRRALAHARLATLMSEQIGRALEAERARHERAAERIQAACRCFVARRHMSAVPTAAAALQVRSACAPPHLSTAAARCHL
jgi:hypothetical protein